LPPARLLAFCTTWVGIGIFLTGPGILAKQVLDWLRYGEWRPFTLAQNVA
jgi:hypothetical protein